MSESPAVGVATAQMANMSPRLRSSEVTYCLLRDE